MHVLTFPEKPHKTGIYKLTCPRPHFLTQLLQASLTKLDHSPLGFNHTVVCLTVNPYCDKQYGHRIGSKDVDGIRTRNSTVPITQELEPWTPWPTTSTLHFWVNGIYTLGRSLRSLFLSILSTRAHDFNHCRSSILISLLSQYSNGIQGRDFSPLLSEQAGSGVQLAYRGLLPQG
jgi:hypothetical protein